MQLFARLEAHRLPRRDRNLGSGARIAADSCLPRAHIEDPKSAELDPVASRKSPLQALKHRVDGCFRLVPRQAGLLDYVMDDVLFYQCGTPIDRYLILMAGVTRRS